MEVGQRCRLRLTDCMSMHGAHTSDEVHRGGISVTGVVVGVRPHAEEPWRRFYYVHCTHVEWSAELSRQRRKAAAPSWCGASLGSVGCGTMHSRNELRATGGGFVSSDGYHYRYDGWYEASTLSPLSAHPPFTEDTAAVAPAHSFSATPPVASPISSAGEGVTSAPSAALSSVGRSGVAEEWVAAMERDTAMCEVVYLCYAFQPWFPAPFGALQYLALPEDDVCHSVYVCHRCLSLFFTREQYYVHLAGRYCRLRAPPGRLIYHDDVTGYKAFLVDGARHLHYCRCLSLLGKFLIESKLLSNDVDLYEYVVVTLPRASLPHIPAALPTCASDGEGGAAIPVSLSTDEFKLIARDFDAEDWDGDVVMGYFSRLKHHPDHTLSCIVTLPMFQRMHVATFLLDLAYWMTQQRQRLCGCAFCGKSGGAVSRPFSPHGQSLLLSYWRRALLRAVAEVAPPHRHASRTPQPELRFTLAELRALFDIPIHTDDLEMLLLHSGLTFYQPIAASTLAATRDDNHDGSNSPVTSSRRRTRRQYISPTSSPHDLQMNSTNSNRKVSSSSPEGGSCDTLGATSSARFTGTLVLEAALVEAATRRRSSSSRHTYGVFNKRFLVQDRLRGLYAYDTPYFHY